jgi:hypothetical protein
MSDADVDAMARATAPAIARRIAKHSPSKPTGKLADDKAAPPEITAAEMRQIQQRGRLTKALRERLAEAVRSDVSAEPAPSKKRSPRREPYSDGQ